MQLMILVLYCCIAPVVAGECTNWQQAHPEWVFCDDFEDGTALVRTGRYFEYDNNAGDFAPISGVGMNGSIGMRTIFQVGEVTAGSIKLGFGRNPIGYMNKGICSSEDFREIYYRMYLKMEDGWDGDPAKLSRATVFANANWGQAMIAHLWGNGAKQLLIDPASCVSPDNTVRCNTYNDFANLAWLGNRSGITPVFDISYSGRWFCIEAHVKLNDPGMSNGIQEFWIDGNLEASRSDLNFVYGYNAYAINAIFFENYWNSGSIKQQQRFFDNIVVSRKPIGQMVTPTADVTPPFAGGYSPAKGATNVATDATISFHVQDVGDGVNSASIKLRVNGLYVTPTITGTPADYLVTYKPAAGFVNGSTVNISIDAADLSLSANAMATDSYAFVVASQPTQSDVTPPVAGCFSPSKGATNVSPSTTMSFCLTDQGKGVDAASVVLKINGVKVAATITGSPDNLLVTYKPAAGFAQRSTVRVTINASDLASPANVMATVSYSFKTGRRTAKEATFRILPNPSLGIGLNASELSDASIEIRGFDGSRLYQSGLNQQGSFVVGTGSKSQGVYLAVLKTNGRTVVKKVCFLK